jgi:undecaprenyl-diphosphatase
VNEYALAALLGVVEGLTEFLPVSSTAHLRICEALLGVDLGNAYWKTFSIVIQLGAILCLPIYFRDRLVAFARTFPRGSRGDRTALTHPFSLTLLAFVVTAIPAFLLARVIGKHLESLSIMAAALIVGGVVMAAVDLAYERSRHRAFARGRLTEDVEQMTVAQAVWIGACQVLAAVFPGTSRSMATITAGELAGMSRPAALEFSFLVSIPTMVAATTYDLLRSLRPAAGRESAIGAMANDGHAWTLLAIGFVVSFIVAYGVVAWFMSWVRSRGFLPFAVYRIVAGTAVLWWA